MQVVPRRADTADAVGRFGPPRAARAVERASRYDAGAPRPAVTAGARPEALGPALYVVPSALVAHAPGFELGIRAAGARETGRALAEPIAGDP